MTLLLERQTAVKAATNQVQTAKELVTAAETRLAELTRQIKPLTESVKSSAAKLCRGPRRPLRNQPDNLLRRKFGLISSPPSMRASRLCSVPAR